MLPKIFGISSYIIMAIIGFALAFVLGVVRRKKYGYKMSDLVGMLSAIIIGLLIGARLLFIITEIPALINHNFSWEIIQARVINGGLVFYGGLIGAVLGLYLIAKYLKLDTLKVMNFATPCLPAFHFFGRIGCLLDGCCYGVEAEHGLIMAGETVKRVPTQLIEAIALLVITAALLLIEYYCMKKEKKFELLSVYAMMYAPARFVIEIWRGDILRGVSNIIIDYKTSDGGIVIKFALSTSQIISIAIIVIVLLYWLYRHLLKKQAKKLAATVAAPIQEVCEKPEEKTEEPYEEKVEEPKETE